MLQQAVGKEGQNRAVHPQQLPGHEMDASRGTAGPHQVHLRSLYTHADAKQDAGGRHMRARRTREPMSRSTISTALGASSRPHTCPLRSTFFSSSWFGYRSVLCLLSRSLYANSFVSHVSTLDMCFRYPYRLLCTQQQGVVDERLARLLVLRGLAGGTPG